ncbi:MULTISPECIES: hypothetical protein [unclassified Rathayibacter]|uniref:hypothetical protein n=1 Tax=unclassified Rathayibacter TaxID=2609250 RepID=UPI0006F1D54F|nr:MULTISPECIES: hypothetical protein [unclassified Rathayibacter]KQP95965.1 hypothetical protein ASF42_19245 [Rathayibacter sp. Leaf294]KQS07686.1 hypothetical protein ASG06_17895 [Rathayibacter sp. Leaf185]
MAVTFDELRPGSLFRVSINGADMDFSVRDATHRFLDANLEPSGAACTLVFARFASGVESSSPEVKANLMREAVRLIDEGMIGGMLTERGNAFFRVEGAVLL